MLYGPTAFNFVLTRVRDAIAAALRDGGDVPKRVVIMPGAIAWDECDQCGLLALTATRQFLSNEFPTETPTADAANSMPGAVLCSDMVVQAIRCAPTATETGQAPSVEALEASARQVQADAYAVMCSTLDTLADMDASGDIYAYMVRQQAYVGPEGACVGSELSFVVGIIR